MAAFLGWGGGGDSAQYTKAVVFERAVRRNEPVVVGGGGEGVILRSTKAVVF